MKTSDKIRKIAGNVKDGSVSFEDLPGKFQNLIDNIGFKINKVEKTKNLFHFYLPFIEFFSKELMSILRSGMFYSIQSSKSGMILTLRA